MQITLNHNGNTIFVKNLLNAIRSWRESNDLVFNIYDNSFIKPTKDVNKEYETKNLDKQIKGDDKDKLSNIESDVSGLVKLKNSVISSLYSHHSCTEFFQQCFQQYYLQGVYLTNLYTFFYFYQPLI